MDASKQIDEYISKLTDWRGARIAELRKLINSVDPELTEDWKWNSPVWTKNGLVCSVGAFKDKVKLNFFKRDGLEDPKGMLNAGLESKQPAIDMNENDKVDEAALKALIKNAITLNS